jgi:hypothetical protein
MVNPESSQEWLAALTRKSRLGILASPWNQAESRSGCLVDLLAGKAGRGRISAHDGLALLK